MPLVPLKDRLFVLELFHGPSLAFKDFGARFLARMLAHRTAREGLKLRTVLVATSGDTGAAVAQAFWKVKGVRAVVLYPKGRVSPLQEAQFATLGGNVLAYAVEGSFDDCQRLAKAAFADPAVAGPLALVSANSINIARLLAQVLYYLRPPPSSGPWACGRRPSSPCLAATSATSARATWPGPWACP